MNSAARGYHGCRVGLTAGAGAAVASLAGNDIGGAQNRLGVLFFLLLFLSLMSLSSLPVWHDERLLFRRERDASTYGTSAYFVAVYAFDILPLRVLPPTFFALLAYRAIGLHPGCAGCIWWFVILLVLANVASATCSMAIGAATSSNSTANLVGYAPPCDPHSACWYVALGAPVDAQLHTADVCCHSRRLAACSSCCRPSLRASSSTRTTCPGGPTG